MTDEITKVFAYVISGEAPHVRLLLFDSLDELGYEVPKGAVEPGESLECAVRREVHEEAGIRGLRGIRFLGTTLWEGERQHFYFAQCPSADGAPFAHVVTGDGVDAGLVYRFQWRDPATLDPARLVQGCGRFFLELKAALGLGRVHRRPTPSRS